MLRILVCSQVSRAQKFGGRGGYRRGSVMEEPIGTASHELTRRAIYKPGLGRNLARSVWRDHRSHDLALCQSRKCFEAIRVGALQLPRAERLTLNVRISYLANDYTSARLTMPKTILTEAGEGLMASKPK
jgi:hypothetical protein